MESDTGLLKIRVDTLEFFLTGKESLCLEEKSCFVMVAKKRSGVQAFFSTTN